MIKDLGQPTQGFTGYWIPIELMQLGLSFTEASLLSMIDSLDKTDDRCFASNAYLAEKMGLSLSRISYYITKLKRMKLIEELSFTGRTRTLGVLKHNWFPQRNNSKKESCVKTSRQTTRLHAGRLRENTQHIEKKIEQSIDDDDRVREASPFPETKTETSIKQKKGPTDLKGEPLIIDESSIWKYMLKFPDIPTHIVEEAIHKLKSQTIPITCPKRYVESVCKNLLQIEKNEELRIKSYGDKNKKKEAKKKEDTHPVLDTGPTITWAEYQESLKQKKKENNERS